MIGESTMSELEKPKFGIIGAGNLGQCMAAHLAIIGYDVSLGNRGQEKLTPIQKADNQIILEGTFRGEKIEGTAHLAVVSTDFEKVIEGRDLIMVTVPADGHGYIASRMAPYLKPHQHVVLHPGHTFGALEVKRTLEEYDPALKDVTISEIQSSLFTTRMIRSGHVFMAAIKHRMALSTIPSMRTHEVFAFFSEIYPEIWMADNVIQTSLDNLNAIAHPVVTLLNAPRIERGESFLYYQEGVSPAVGNIMEMMDEERRGIARSMKVEPCVFKDWMNEVYDLNYDSMYEIFNNNPAYSKITAPNRLDTRYIFEDIPTGLLPMISLGRVAGVDTTLMKAFYDIWCKTFGTDFTENARTLERLGLDKLSKDELIHYVTTGEK